MNRLTAHFKKKQAETLNVYVTAGYPGLNDLLPIAESLERSGVDILEIGIPFSDPTADGTTIQASNQVALSNGMNVELLFEQMEDLRDKVSIPVLLMGYLNPALQYGFDRFLDKCVECGIDGLILPDLPIWEYETLYRPAFEQRNLSNIFLITPQTSEERIHKIDELSKGFIYQVSTYSITGGKTEIGTENKSYFERIQAMKLKNPRLIGFGIIDRSSFLSACTYAHGAIIGSAFIKALEGSNDVSASTASFVKNILDAGSDR